MKKGIALLMLSICSLVWGQTNDFISTSWDVYKAKHPEFIEPMIFMVSNYFPKIDEEVNIEVKYTSPFDWKHNRLNLGFELPEDCVLVKGNNLINEDIKEGEVREVVITVKFRTRSVFRLMIRDSKWSNEGYAANLYFYVGEAFSLSGVVADLESDVKGIKRNLENLKSGRLPDVPTYRDRLESYEDMLNEISIIPRNNYEKGIIDELRQKNISELKKLRNQYASLKTELNKKIEELNEKIKLKENNNKEGVQFEWKRSGLLTNIKTNELASLNVIVLLR